VRVVYLRTARDDLDAIYDHVAAEAGDSADRLVTAIRHAVTSLKDYPFRAPEWSPGTRKLSVGGYAVIYRVTDDRIEIGRILHLRRDLPTLRIDDRTGKTSP
jgi:toxin ParE1/3/4